MLLVLKGRPPKVSCCMKTLITAAHSYYQGSERLPLKVTEGEGKHAHELFITTVPLKLNSVLKQ